MSKKTAEPPKTEEPASDMSPDSFSKFMRYGTHPTPTSFPTLPNYIFNLRLILSTIFGIYLGYLGVTGSKGFTVGLGVTVTMPTMFLERYSKASTEAWDGKLTFQGFMPSVGMLLLMWVWVYNLRHSGSFLEIEEVIEKVVEKVGEVVEEVKESVEASVNDEF